MFFKKACVTFLPDKVLIHKNQSMVRVAGIVLCLAALAGYFFPAVRIEFSILGFSQTVTFNVTSFFNRPDNPFGGLDGAGLSGISLPDALGEAFAGIVFNAAAATAAYLASMVVLTVLLVCLLAGKAKRARTAMPAAAVGLLAFAGYTAATLTESLVNAVQSALEGTLGFFALFIDFTDMITLTLGGGYWLTLAASGGVLLLNGLSLIRDRSRHTDAQPGG